MKGVRYQERCDLAAQTCKIFFKHHFVQQLNGFVDRYFDSSGEAEPQDGRTLDLPPHERTPVSAQGVHPRDTPVLTQGGQTPIPVQGAEGVAGRGGGHQMNSPLTLIEGFLQALTNTDSDGRIVISTTGR